MWSDLEPKRKWSDREGPKAPEDAVDTAEWVRTKLGFTADAAQERVLRTGSRRVVLNCTRQWGKSTVTAAKAVHEAYTKAGSLTMVVSPSGRQSGELVRKAEGFVRRLGIRPKGDGDNEISVMLPNGSRIVGLPGSEDTVRGFSAVSLLLVDEASRVPDGLYLAVRPMMAVSEGTLWLMSTPRGKRGFFYEAWAKGGAEWERVRVPAEECGRISRIFLDEERRTMGEKCFGREYGCEFTDSMSAVFDSDLVAKAISWEVTALRID
jgi:hypothetical protein